MKITIVGAGAVGFNLASAMSAEGYDVSVVEVRSALLTRLRDRLDVSVVEGSGTSAAILREAGTEDADVFIAVTDVDEVNMVACAMAHQMGTGRRIARIRNKDFSGRDPVVPKRTFGISRIINPDDLVVSSLVETIMAPGLTDSAEFGQGEVLLRGTVLGAQSPFTEVPLSRLREKFGDVAFLIAAIERDEEIRIPTGETTLQAKDHLFLILRREALPKLRELVGGDEKKVHRLVLFGAGRIGLSLAEQLEARLDHVVVIEPDEESAQRAAQVLNKALVLKGAVTDPAILADAHIDDADFFVATSHRDEMNLVAAAIAGKGGRSRVAVVTADPDFVPALSHFDLDVVVNERLITVETILRFVRPGRYLSIKRLDEHGAEIMELSVQKGSKADGKALKDVRLPSGALVVAILREGKAILPSGESMVQSGDQVVLVGLAGVREKAARMFFNKKWMSLQER